MLSIVSSKECSRLWYENGMDNPKNYRALAKIIYDTFEYRQRDMERQPKHNHLSH